MRHLVHASHVTADLDSEPSLASTLSGAPEFAASQAFSNIMPFGRCRALVLDSSYRPIDVVNWQRAICLDLFDKVSHLRARVVVQLLFSLENTVTIDFVKWQHTVGMCLYDKTKVAWLLCNLSVSGLSYLHAP